MPETARAADSATHRHLTGAQWTILRGAAEGKVWRAFATNNWYGPQQGNPDATRGCSTSVLSLMQRGLLQHGRDEGRRAYAEPTETGRRLLSSKEDAR